MDTLRLPQAWFPSLFFPMALLAIFTGSFGDAPGNVPGFPPVRGFLDFAVAGSVLQGVLIGGTTDGAAFAADIEGGFFDRLAASPARRSAILVGRLAGASVLAVLQTTVFVLLLGAFGASIKGGLPALAVIYVVAMLLAVGIGGFAVALALKTGSAEAVQGAFPVFFISLFLSSAFFPRELMDGWVRTVADLNPLSWMIEAVRALIIDGFSATDAVRALSIPLAVSLVAIAVASAALRGRVAA